MAREWTLTRTEAEYLVDLLEAQPPRIGMAFELADQLRELFGMIPRKPHLVLGDRRGATMTKDQIIEALNKVAESNPYDAQDTAAAWLFAVESCVEAVTKLYNTTSS